MACAAAPSRRPCRQMAPRPNGRRQNRICFSSDTPATSCIHSILYNILYQKNKMGWVYFYDWLRVYASVTMSGWGTDPCSKFCMWDRAESTSVSKSSSWNWSTVESYFRINLLSCTFPRQKTYVYIEYSRVQVCTYILIYVRTYIFKIYIRTQTKSVRTLLTPW